jgi:TolA-binding protein
MTGRIIFHLTLGALLAAPGSAMAQKFTKKAVDLQDLPVPVHPAPTPAPKAPASPLLTLEQFVSQKQGHLQELSDRQIVYLQHLLKLASPDDPQLPDYLFRLGELFAEKARYWNHRARALDEPIFRAEHGAPARPAAPQRQEQQRNQDKADQSLQKAVHGFVAASKYPRYGRMDDVLYRLGYLLQTAGRGELSREVFRRLLKEYPSSRHVPDAYLSFADDFFAKGDMAQALAFYDKVTRFQQSSVFGFALYKKAWAQANLGDFKAALGTLVDLLGECRAGRIDPAQRGPLEKEARRDLVRVYARTAGAEPDRALEFFRRVADSEAPLMMQMLAELYWEEGLAANSSRVYRKLMSLQPQAPSLCVWQDRIVRNTLATGSEPQQVQEMQRLGTAYRYVQQLGQAKPAVVSECRGRYRDLSRELAFVLHKQAQRTKQLPTFQWAAAAYREFLSLFESETAATEAAFYYAECLWQIAAMSPPSDALWRQAAEQYTHVIQLNPRSPYVKEAAYASVLAWQNAVYQNNDDLYLHASASS